jgi:hypothetical protein
VDFVCADLAMVNPLLAVKIDNDGQGACARCTMVCDAEERARVMKEANATEFLDCYASRSPSLRSRLMTWAQAGGDNASVVWRSFGWKEEAVPMLPASTAYRSLFEEHVREPSMYCAMPLDMLHVASGWAETFYKFVASRMKKTLVPGRAGIVSFGPHVTSLNISKSDVVRDFFRLALPLLIARDDASPEDQQFMHTALSVYATITRLILLLVQPGRRANIAEVHELANVQLEGILHNARRTDAMWSKFGITLKYHYLRCHVAPDLHYFGFLRRVSTATGEKQFMSIKNAYAETSKKKDSFAMSLLRVLLGGWIMRDVDALDECRRRQVDLTCSWKSRMESFLVSANDVIDMTLSQRAAEAFRVVFGRHLSDVMMNVIENELRNVHVLDCASGLDVALMCSNRSTCLRSVKLRTNRATKTTSFHAIAFLGPDEWDPSRSWFNLSGMNFEQCRGGQSCEHCLERYAIMAPVTHPRACFTLPFAFARTSGGRDIVLGLRLVVTRGVHEEDDFAAVLKPAFAQVTVAATGPIVDVIDSARVCGNCPIVIDHGRGGELMSTAKDNVLLGCFWNYVML